MKQKGFRFAVAALMLLSFTSVFAGDLPVIGWLEDVQIENGRLDVKAKIDTGADVSSINADNIKRFERDGEEWVQFVLANNEGEEITLEKKVIRYATIKRKRAEPIVRPVISLGVCIGEIYRQTHVNLANRSNFDYKMLIGRTFLRETYVVDSSVVFTSKPVCHLGDE